MYPTIHRHRKSSCRPWRHADAHVSGTPGSAARNSPPTRQGAVTTAAQSTRRGATPNAAAPPNAATDPNTANSATSGYNASPPGPCTAPTPTADNPSNQAKNGTWATNLAAPSAATADPNTGRATGQHADPDAKTPRHHRRPHHRPAHWTPSRHSWFFGEASRDPHVSRNLSPMNENLNFRPVRASVCVVLRCCATLFELACDANPVELQALSCRCWGGSRRQPAG